MHSLTLSVATALLAASPLNGAFDGPYAPDLWTFIPGPGGFVDKHTADSLVLIGGDAALGGDTDMTITVVTDGVWSFHWEFAVPNSTEPFEASYYLVNGKETLLSDHFFGKGDIAMNVQAGDVIGYRVSTADGFFGPGILTITNFDAPVPGPGAVAVLLPLLLAAHRRRRRASLEPRSSP